MLDNDVGTLETCTDQNVRQSLSYDLCHAPSFVQEPTQHDIDMFNADFTNVCRICFRLLRNTPHVNPNTIVYCKSAGMSIVECCLIWAKMDIFKKRVTQLKTQLKRSGLLTPEMTYKLNDLFQKQWILLQFVHVPIHDIQKQL